MERIKSIDIAKAIGIFLIVIGHTLRSGSLLYYIYSFHVPLFFILIGLCWSNNKSFLNFTRNKIKTILIPYFVFACISITIFSLLSHVLSDKLFVGKDANRLYENFFGMIYANSKLGNMEWNKPLWFLPCLFVCCIIVYFVDLFSHNKTKRRLFFASFLFLMNFLIANNFSYLLMPFQLETALGMAGYLEMGVICKEYYGSLEAKVRSLCAIKTGCIILALNAIGICAILLNSNVRIDVRIDHYGNYFLYIIGAISLSLCVLIVSSKIRSILLEYIGKNTLWVLLMHKFPIVFFQAIFPGGSIVLTDPNSIQALIVTILVCMITVSLCVLLGYTFRRLKKSFFNKQNKAVVKR